MKFLIAFSCLLAVAIAKPQVLAPFAYSGVAPAASFGYSSVSHHGAYPYSYGYPYAYNSYPYHAVAPVHHAYSAVAPVVAPVAPVVAPVVPAYEKSQFHAQDVFGQARYGHHEAFQAHTAAQDVHGNKVGAYSYVAPNGEVISTEYVADALGFRARSNALPVAPEDTAEVKAAKEEHMKAVEEAKHRSRRSVFYNAPFAYSHPYAYSYPYAYSTPVFKTVAPVVSTPVFKTVAPVVPVVKHVAPVVPVVKTVTPVVAPVVNTVYSPVVAKSTAYNHVVSTPFQHTESYAVKHF